VPADARARTDRRGFVLETARAAGVAPAALAVIEGTASALPRGEETDMAILSAALMIEHHAIALYAHGLERGLFPRGLRAYAVEFRGDHLGHRDTQVAIMEERGARAPVAPGYDFPSAQPGNAFLRQALEIEVAAQLAYTGLISQIRTDDYLLSAGFILVDEVRHMTVWRRVLGLRIY
jgi:ferritin-like protein